MKPNKHRVAQIAALNDKFRRTLKGGHFLLTNTVSELPEREQIVQKVRDFNEFTEANDPYGEHDFGSIVHDGQTYFWKIDYYDVDMKMHSREPANAIVTTRVLTLMRADEY